MSTLSLTTLATAQLEYEKRKFWQIVHYVVEINTRQQRRRCTTPLWNCTWQVYL